ncbi:hypothetical protein Barb6_02975 [Bacteroidales bacterium Barb6]|nr:hypothetical protein Barb6_02975 [Bacteroidales bacterium Barb6]
MLNCPRSAAPYRYGQLVVALRLSNTARKLSDFSIERFNPVNELSSFAFQSPAAFNSSADC